MYSEIALKIYSAVRQGVIKSRYQFWKKFSCIDKIDKFSIDVSKEKEFLDKADFNITCVFDSDFPKIVFNVKLADKPFLFEYIGDIQLLNEINRNIAIIGTTKISAEIQTREQSLLNILLQKNVNIVSGLALGCDSIAHKSCIEKEKQTIAFLPCSLLNIYPKGNSTLAQKIVDGGGVLVTEYFDEPRDRYENIRRFIERDRLQAMFSKAIILIASYSKGQGDSGSRHAIEKAKQYGNKKLYVLYDKAKDHHKAEFSLNKELIENEIAQVATKKAIEELLS